MLRNKFSRWLRDYLAAEKMGQSEFAAECGVTRQYIHEIISGNSPPSQKVITALQKRGVSSELLYSKEYQEGFRDGLKCSKGKKGATK
jgi:transcriptional regulator with XRE-family HTH domain